MFGIAINRDKKKFQENTAMLEIYGKFLSFHFSFFLLTFSFMAGWKLFPPAGPFFKNLIGVQHDHV